MSEQENPHGLEAGMIAEDMQDSGRLGVVKEIPGGFLAVESLGQGFTYLDGWRPHRIHRENAIIPLSTLSELGVKAWKAWEVPSRTDTLTDTLAEAVHLLAVARRRALDLAKPTFEEPTEATSLIRVTRKDGTTRTYVRDDVGRWIVTSGTRLALIYSWDEIIHNAVKVEVLYAPAKEGQ